MDTTTLILITRLKIHIICFKDITSDLALLADADGTYTLADELQEVTELEVVRQDGRWWLFMKVPLTSKFISVLTAMQSTRK
jgi:hypothetical protein